MKELREHTNLVLYENWHTEKLLVVGVEGPVGLKEVKSSVSFDVYPMERTSSPSNQEPLIFEHPCPERKPIFLGEDVRCE